MSGERLEIGDDGLVKSIGEKYSREELAGINRRLLEANRFTREYLMVLKERTKTPEVALMLEGCIDKLTRAIAQADHIADVSKKVRR